MVTYFRRDHNGRIVGLDWERHRPVCIAWVKAGKGRKRCDRRLDSMGRCDRPDKHVD